VSGLQPPLRSTYSSPSCSSWCGLKYSSRLGSVFTRLRPNPRTALTRITAADNIGNGRAQNLRGGSASTILLSRGTAQRGNGGYITYTPAKPTVDPSTPTNPSPRNGLASTISKLAKQSEATTIDQNDGATVMRTASVARSGDFFSN